MTERKKMAGGAARYSVGQLARLASLSRSTLLHYDSIGLLRPSSRSPSNYRVYDEGDRGRLEQICRYREAGLSLKDIAELLDARDDETVRILERHLEQLSDEVARFREQQRVVVRLLQSRTNLGGVRVMDKARWVALLAATGLGDDDMARWHVEFERMAPAAHRDFLRSLGLPADEIETIRRNSR